MLSQLKITLKWWQAGLYELAVLALGILIGVHWSEFFSGLDLTLVLLAILITAGSYIIYLWLKQNPPPSDSTT